MNDLWGWILIIMVCFGFSLMGFVNGISRAEDRIISSIAYSQEYKLSGGNKVKCEVVK